MVAFEKMWDDVSALLSNSGSINNIKNVDGYNGVFMVYVDGDPLFLTKDDFVDFWCRMLYFNQVSRDQIVSESSSRLGYVYEIVRNLPYVKEDSGVLTLVEE